MASNPSSAQNPVCGCGHEDTWHVEFTGGCQVLGCDCTRFRLPPRDAPTPSA